jgi:hypothetical protein
VLAVWVKLGGYPFHPWSQTGRRLSLASQAWLYATVVPNLGLYLLYRVTPLLAHAGPVQTAALWFGAIGALLAAILALAHPEPRAAMVHIGAAQGGLALVVAAAGVKPAVWLGLLALTPLRLLLFLATNTAQSATSTATRRTATGISAFGGLALAAFNLIIVWWIRGSVPTVALFIAQVAAALVGAWTVAKILPQNTKPRGVLNSLRRSRATTQKIPEQVRESSSSQYREERNTVAAISSDCTNPQSRETQEARFGNRGYKNRWAAIGLLSIVVLVGGLAFGPLVRFAADVTHTVPLAAPTLQTLTASLPALFAAALLKIALRRLHHRTALPRISQRQGREAWDSEKGLTRIAETLHAAIEVTILERTISWIKQTVTGSASIIWIVEHGILEGIVNRSVQAVMGSADIAHRTIEQEGLEGTLRRAVSTALALGRSIQRWHTGRLRRNLLWVPIVLALAILALAVYGS